MGSSRTRPLFAFALAAAMACNTLSGIDEIGLCRGDECTDAAGSFAPDASLATGDAMGADAEDTGARDEAEMPPAPPCATCDAGTCCAPNVCRTNGTCASCGSTQTLPCGADRDCCSGQKCSWRGQCVDTCSGSDGMCMYAPGVGTGTCCFGFRCELVTFYGRCVTCTPMGAQCSNPEDCCNGDCVGGTCAPP